MKFITRSLENHIYVHLSSELAIKRGNNDSMPRNSINLCKTIFINRSSELEVRPAVYSEGVHARDSVTRLARRSLQDSSSSSSKQRHRPTERENSTAKAKIPQSLTVRSFRTAAGTWLGVSSSSFSFSWPRASCVGCRSSLGSAFCLRNTAISRVCEDTLAQLSCENRNVRLCCCCCRCATYDRWRTQERESRWESNFSHRITV